MATSSYLVKIGADASSVTRSLSSINKEMSYSKKASSELDKAFKFTGDTSILTQKLGVLNRQLELSKAKSASFKQELDKMKASPGFDANSTKAQKLRGEIEKADAEVARFNAEIQNVKQLKVKTDTSGIDKLKSSLSGIGSGVGKSLDVLGGAIMKVGGIAVATAGTIAAAGIGTLLASSIKEATESYGNFQSLSATFDFAGRTQKDFQAAKGFIMDYAAQTEFSAADITQAWTQMGLDGSKASQDLISGLGGLTQAFSDPGEAMKALLPQLAQVQTAGKLMNEDYKVMKQYLGADIVNALQASMEKAGAFQGSFQDALSNGEISADELNAAIRDVGNNPALQEQARSAGTLSGAFGAAAGDISSALYPIVEQLMPSVTGAIQTAGTAISDFISSINFQPAIDEVTSFGSQFGQAIADAFSFDTSLTSTEGLMIAVYGLEGAFATAGGVISVFAGMVSLAAGFLEQLAVTAYNVGTVIGAVLAGDMDVAAQKVQNLKAGLEQNGLEKFGLDAIQAGGNLMGMAVQSGQAMQSVADGTWTASQQASQNLQAGLGQMPGIAATATAQAGSNLKANLGTAAADATIQGAAATNNLGAGLAGMPGKASAAGQGASNGLQAGTNPMGGIGNAAGAAATSGLNAGLSGAGGAGSRGGSSATSGFRSGASGMSGAGSQAGQSAVSGVASAVGGAGSAGRSVGSSAQSGAKSGIGDWSSIGSFAAQGLAAGIVSASGGLYSIAAGIAGKIKSTLQSALKIHSPSRLMRDEVGTYVTQGIAVGMTEDLGQFNGVAKQIANASRKALDNQNFGEASIGYSLNNMTDSMNATIRSSASSETAKSGETTNYFDITIEADNDPQATAREIERLIVQRQV